MINLARSWRRVAGSGHFFTWPVLPVTGVLAMTAMGPLVTDNRQADVRPGELAAAATWLVFTAVILMGAWLERRLTSPGLRTVSVVGAVFIASVSRPFIQDALMTAWGGHPPEAAHRGERMITNFVVWLVALSIVGVVVDAERTRRRSNQLLRQALSQLQTTSKRAGEFDRLARERVDRCTREFRAELATWPGQRDLSRTALTFAADRVRPCSHELARQAYAPLPPAPDTAAGSVASYPRRPALRLPPVGLVGVIYVLIFLPYACARLTPREIVCSIVVLLVGGLFADLAPRVLPHRFIPRARPTLFLILTVGVGAAITLTSVVVGRRSGIPVLAPLIAYPLFALVTGRCYAVMFSRKVAERRLDSAVAQASRSEHLSTAGARTALTAASDLLHRDLQAACVLLAHDPADVSRIDRARAVVDEVAAVFDTQPEGPDWSAFASLIRTWGRVVTIEESVDSAARKAIQDRPHAAVDAYEVIAEGLLNAVKHAPKATIRVVGRAVETGAGSSLRVRVISLGASSDSTDLRRDSAAARAGASLRQESDGVVLEALIPLEDRLSRVVV